jgi:hypothetical protein
MASPPPLVIDDRSSGTLQATSGTAWRVVTDGVMGGRSRATLAPDRVGGRPCLRLHGEVSLENNGGFVQAALDLAPAGTLDARAYRGIEVDVYGNGETYGLHLRTADTHIVWQAYRAEFHAAPAWQTVRLPFADFRPHRIERALNPGTLRRVGVVAIGRAMQADLCVGRVALYR